MGAIASALRFSSEVPCKLYWPELAWSSRPIILSSVDFPVPELPVIANILPAATCKEVAGSTKYCVLSFLTVLQRLWHWIMGDNLFSWL